MAKPTIDYTSLTPEERLELIEELWDSLSEDPEHVPLTDAQREELDRRLDDLEGGTAKTIPWEEARASLWNKGK